MFVWYRSWNRTVQDASSDWNHPDASARVVRVVDETLRDGLQSPSARNPPVEAKVALLHHMAAAGVDLVSVGLPAAHQGAVDDAVVMLREIQRAGLSLVATAAARTVASDVEAIVTVSQRAGVALEVYAFIGSSPIRHAIEGWDLAFLLRCVQSSAEVARRNGLRFCLVTEDTTRASPDLLGPLFAAAIDAGASRLCLCDTVGHADSYGSEALVRYVRSFLDARRAQHVRLDWHGHNDRGLSLGNALSAVRAGVDRVHGTALGIGERCGNTPTEQLLYNLRVNGLHRGGSVAALRTYCVAAADALAWPLLGNEPLVGRDGHEDLAAPGAHPASDLTPSLTTLSTTINGDLRVLATHPSRSLLEVLREDLALVGSKQGCDKGDCGSCTVLLDGKPVLSCLTLAVECHDHSVRTVEGLRGHGTPHVLLDTFDRHGAGQCGFCTSGMLVTALGLLEHEPAPSRERIRSAISGNLCRCTGYGAIIDAIDEAARSMQTRASKETAS